MSKTQRAIDHLRRCTWARELLRRMDLSPVRDEGILFEARFAFELSLACPDGELTYEYAAGVGESTIDFRVTHEGRVWLIELVALQETKTIENMRSASRINNHGVSCESIVLGDTAENRRETLFAEAVHVVERMQDKVWDRRLRRPHKFPVTSDGTTHVLVVNMDGFQGTGTPDDADCHELIFGSRVVAPEWRADPREDVRGLFDQANDSPGGRTAQERLHAVAFVAERHDDDDEIRRTAYFLGNRALGGEALIQDFPVIAPRERRDPLHRSEFFDR